MEKYEWRKKDKELYLPKDKPVMIDVPKLAYFTIEGKGSPNSESFNQAVEALYTLSYGIRMMPRKGIKPEGYYEYTVFPLEGIWDLDEEGRKAQQWKKEQLVYKLMIRQPEFITEELFQYGKETAQQKKGDLPIERVQLEFIEEGKCVQMLHLGSYDDELRSFAVMEEYCAENNLHRVNQIHKEIYISDPRKTAVEKLKTVLRFKVMEG